MKVVALYDWSDLHGDRILTKGKHYDYVDYLDIGDSDIYSIVSDDGGGSNWIDSKHFITVKQYRSDVLGNLLKND